MFYPSALSSSVLDNFNSALSLIFAVSPDYDSILSGFELMLHKILRYVTLSFPEQKNQRVSRVIKVTCLTPLTTFNSYDDFVNVQNQCKANVQYFAILYADCHCTLLNKIHRTQHTSSLIKDVPLTCFDHLEHISS